MFLIAPRGEKKGSRKEKGEEDVEHARCEFRQGNARDLRARLVLADFGNVALLVRTVGSCADASYLKRNSAMDDSIGGS